MDDDDEYMPTEDEILAEEEDEPLMMSNAGAWDNFLEFVRLCQSPWAAEEDDTDLFRKQRAVEYFNAGVCPRACPASCAVCSLPRSPFRRQQGRPRPH